jgi:hypothetical protein
MRSPYRHFGRYGYLSGSRSCSRKPGISVLAPGIGSRRWYHVQYSLVKTGDSSSITSLSICTSRDTVSSSSALRIRQQALDRSPSQFRHTRSAASSTRARTPEQEGTEQKQPQRYDTMIGTATRIASGHPVLREYGASRRNESTHLRLEVLQTATEICQLGRGDQDHVELDDHHTGKLQVLRRSAISLEAFSTRG